MRGKDRHGFLQGATTRSTSLDRDSSDSGDRFNRLLWDWSAGNGFGELLKIRASSPVFTLGTLAEVQRRRSFPVSGAGEMPGVITMHLDSSGLDPPYGGGPRPVIITNAASTGY